MPSEQTILYFGPGRASPSELVTRFAAEHARQVVQVDSASEVRALLNRAFPGCVVLEGDTAVIGGIYSTRDGRSWQKVPWFAELPVIGWLFKTKRDTSDREEMLIFLTPRIVNRAESIGR